MVFSILGKVLDIESEWATFKASTVEMLLDFLFFLLRQHSITDMKEAVS